MNRALGAIMVTTVVVVMAVSGLIPGVAGIGGSVRAAAPFGVIFQQQDALPTSTPLPTNTPLATSTPRPQSTNYPTPTVVGANETPVPTPTLLPTHTPEPTHTPLPTLTPNPTFTPVATHTPIPDVFLAATKAAADCAPVGLRCDVTGTGGDVEIVFIPPASYVTPTPTPTP